MIVTVVGSYPKIPDRPLPARLRTAFARLDRGEITPQELAGVEDIVTRDVLREQAATGAELLTDGNVRWQDEQTYIAGRLGGIHLNGLRRFFDTNTYFREPVVEGQVAWHEPLTLRDYEFARGQAAIPVKPVLPGPLTLAHLSKNEYYEREEDLVLDYAAALNDEAKALQQADPPLIQFNEPAAVNGGDLALAEKAWQRLLDGLQVETAVYFYFGHRSEALVTAIEAGFTTVGVDATIPGVLESLKDGRRPRKLAVGVVDSRTTRVEPLDQVRALVKSALSLVASENLYVNPNQGLEYLPRDQARAKLVRLVDAVNSVRQGEA
jgi:5-methyltetrahydropteroyltriglutamate--homocysteine methyltransferase